MANPNAKPPTSCAAVLWVEQEVDAWIKAKIRGVDWQPAEHDQPNLIRKREVLRRAGFSHFTIWNLERQGKFPCRLRIGEVADAAD